MARIRTIKPKMWDHAQLNRASPMARLTFIGLISFADDEGRGKADVELMWGRMHSGAHPNVRRRWPETLAELAGIHDENGPLVVFYEVAGAKYYWLPGFCKQQRIDKPYKSELPPPPNSQNDPRTLRERSSQETGEGRQEKGGGSGNGIPPTPEPNRDENITPPPPSPEPDLRDDMKAALEKDRGARGLAMLYRFCRSPGYSAKVAALDDLIRIGVSPDLIASYATTQEAQVQDFYEIVKTLKERTNGKRDDKRDEGSKGYVIDHPRE